MHMSPRAAPLVLAAHLLLLLLPHEAGLITQGVPGVPLRTP
jgi:hypothetical protein